MTEIISFRIDRNQLINQYHTKLLTQKGKAFQISNLININQYDFIKIQNARVLELYIEELNYKRIRSRQMGLKQRETCQDQNSNYNYIRELHHLLIQRRCNFETVYEDLLFLQRELNQDNYINSEVLNNMEQIIHLKWHGEYGQNQRKLGKWVATWSGEALQNVGGYYKDGLKEGLWKEPIKNYQSNAQVFESGGYFHNQKCGRWNFIQNNETIGGGSYNQQAQKNGKWTELQEGFSDDLQVTWKGEYKIGIKVGIWDILYENSKIGGGSFGDGQGIKQGNWVEIWKGFYYFSQVTENGEYKNGKKFGRWDIWYKDIENNTITKIGGGSYDEGGNKSANWVEISDGFCEDSQVIYHGEYQNGKKIGKWDIWYKKEYGDLENTRMQKIIYKKCITIQKYVCFKVVVDHMMNKAISKVVGLNQRMVFVKILKQFRMGNIKMEKKLVDGIFGIEKMMKTLKCKKQYISAYTNTFMCESGGGQYDEEGNGIKFGKWVEISDGFYDSSQVTWDGDYKNNKKIGKWDIWYENSKIGGGSYDELGQEIKLGYWVEVSEGFKYDQQVTWDGEYKNGKKFGRWDLWYKDIDSNKITKIGDASYDELGQETKLGNWAKVSEGFNNDSQITKKGEYKIDKNFDIWMIRENKVKEIDYEK
ncbi:unnamed protein product [Paramecium pentaurelia]|uniref:Uncharacterized protein n=1 Tax=Paramecium pentaurelia TaxID=43138 RepID=A0A8S1WF76_9CILI|nr:unnamed protein product [Paramecium pentaurelia]